MNGAPDAEALPAEAGAYLLILDLARPLRLDIKTLPGARLETGRYAYAGSARGPGGIRARVARHLRADKKTHWHIDRLTARARITDLRVFPGGSECELVARLLAQADTSVPVPGFGSSDCARCESHLVALSPESLVGQ